MVSSCAKIVGFGLSCGMMFPSVAATDPLPPLVLNDKDQQSVQQLVSQQPCSPSDQSSLKGAPILKKRLKRVNRGRKSVNTEKQSAAPPDIKN